jgi:hypothetical protein
VRVQMPLAVPGGRPEPDLALAEDAGPREHPRTAELVVEVAITWTMTSPSCAATPKPA